MDLRLRDEYTTLHKYTQGVRVFAESTRGSTSAQWLQWRKYAKYSGVPSIESEPPVRLDTVSQVRVFTHRACSKAHAVYTPSIRVWISYRAKCKL